MSRRRRIPRLRPRLALAGVAAALTVALAQNPVSAAFTAVTSSSGNSVTTGAQFCTAPATTLTPAGDSWVDESNPTTNNGGDPLLHVVAQNPGDRRTLIRFPLPAAPAGCLLDSATLSVYNSSPTPGRTIDVYRGDPAAPQWASTGTGSVTWADQPAAVGTAVGSPTPGSAGWQTWTVTAHVQAQLAGVNNGFVLRDRSENVTGPYPQVYESMQHATLAPRLVLNWS